ncbi:GNAT family protein [Peribacillus kribbensis]|uniref:GNAT family N-acetyltransferase n=1 Tax=Peribacillus kribbensis TaxID=356658 RepID=UPI00040207CC
MQDTAENIQERLKGLVENGGYPKSFAIIHRGKIAGTVGFNEINKSAKIGEIGYWLGQEFQGKGIMTKAVKALIEYGFKDLGLNRVEAYAASGNSKSRDLIERLGFTQEGIIRQAEWLYDHYVDHVVYGLLAEEWKCIKQD